MSDATNAPVVSADDVDAHYATVLGFNEEILPATHKAVMQRAAAARGEMHLVDRGDIRIKEGLNPRIQDASYHAHVRWLADSMKEKGFFADKPIAVYAGYDGKRPVMYVVDGFCRMAAYDLALSEGAPLLEIPVILSPNSTSMEDLTVNFVVSNSGKRLTPMEVSIVCKRLQGFGWNDARIASSLHITQEYVGQLLTLAGAPREIRNMVQNGEMTASLAVETLRKHGPDVMQVVGEAMATAKADGKVKLTKRYMPEQIQRKYVTKQAPVVIDAIKRLQTHEAFRALPDDLRGVFEDFLKGMDKAVQAKEAVQGETVVDGGVAAEADAAPQDKKSEAAVA